MAAPFFTMSFSPRLRDVRGRFASMRDRGAVERSRAMLQDIARVLIGELKEEAPVGKHYKLSFVRGSKPTVQEIKSTKRLRDSFFFRTYVKPKGINLGIYSRTPDKLKWVIRGTHPFKRERRFIYPKTKKVLAFYWARKQKIMVLPFVKHPGSLPNPFHERALQKARPRIDPLARKAARDIAEGLTWKGPGGGMEVI